MKFNVMLLVLGLHSTIAGAWSPPGDYDERQRQAEQEIEEIGRAHDRREAEYEAQRQRTRPIQVIEPGGVRTFYPDSSGGSWVTYDPPLRSRR